MEDVIRDVPFFVALNLNQHVAWIKHSRRFNALIAAHLHYCFSWDEDLGNFRLQISIADASLQAIANLLLVTGVGMEYEPLLHGNSLLRTAENLVSQPRNSINASSQCL